MRFRRHQEAARGQTRWLLVLFALIVLALVAAVNAALAIAYHLSFPLVHAYPAFFFETNTGLVLLAVLGGCWFEQWRLQEGGAHVARLAGGVPALGPHGRPNGPLEKRLLNVVQEMALASRMRPPAAWVLPRDDTINAFAAGWSEDDAVIGVTRGALERLTREELQGVIAHECSHLAHGDTRLNMRLIGMVWGLEMVFGFGRSLSSRNDDGRVPPGALFGWALVAVGSLGWMGGRLLQAAVSRQREFLADASAVQYTRNPAGLGGALRKIAGVAAGERRARGAVPLQAPHVAALAHLLLSTPGASRWTSHPPLAERIRRLCGRSLSPLPAPALPALNEADEPDWLPALSTGTVGLATKTTITPEMAVASMATARPQGRVRHADVTLDPDLQGAAERERDAIDRIGRWAGPGERRAALLALLIDRSPAERGVARRIAWQAATAELPCAAAVWSDVQALRPTARKNALTLLARSGATAPRVERLTLRAALHALADGPAEQLRALAMRELLDGHKPRWPRPDPRNRLQALAPVIAETGTALAQALGLNLRDAADWQATVLGLLGLRAQRPALHSDPASLRRAIVRLRRLAPLERPRLARAWLDASASRLTQAATAVGTAEVLQLACLLLDTPPPQSLADGEPGTHPDAMASLQVRSL
ncbi:MAG: M48 family metalloprotease [Methylibium sp.]|nr:M48 family metalloprotease [Methylibium sp.]